VKEKNERLIKVSGSHCSILLSVNFYLDQGRHNRSSNHFCSTKYGWESKIRHTMA